MEDVEDEKQIDSDLEASSSEEWDPNEDEPPEFDLGSGKSKAKKVKDFFQLSYQRHDKLQARKHIELRNFQNLPEEVAEGWPAVQEEMRHTVPPMEEEMFAFKNFMRRARCTILHFQLRNLVWTPSATEIYYTHEFRIKRYNTLSHDYQDVLDVRNCPEGKKHNMHDMAVSTFAIKHGILLAGGFWGELMMRKLDGGPVVCRKLNFSDSGIVNGIEIKHRTSGGFNVITASNDHTVQILDTDSLAPEGRIPLPWAVNWVASQPQQGKLLTIVGDDPVSKLYDSASLGQVAELKGHLDYAFAAAWHPNGQEFATGNQDRTTRIWDVRRTDRAVKVFESEGYAIRSLRYSPDGQYLAVAEACDFTTLLDTEFYERKQTIDLAGEITGVSFTPDSTAFLVGVQNDRLSGVMQFQRPFQDVSVRSTTAAMLDTKFSRR